MLQPQAANGRSGGRALLRSLSLTVAPRLCPISPQELKAAQQPVGGILDTRRQEDIYSNPPPLGETLLGGKKEAKDEYTGAKFGPGQARGGRGRGRQGGVEATQAVREPPALVAGQHTALWGEGDCLHCRRRVPAPRLALPIAGWPGCGFAGAGGRVCAVQQQQRPWICDEQPRGGDATGAAAQGGVGRPACGAFERACGGATQALQTWPTAIPRSRALPPAALRVTGLPCGALQPLGPAPTSAEHAAYAVLCQVELGDELRTELERQLVEFTTQLEASPDSEEALEGAAVVNARLGNFKVSK